MHTTLCLHYTFCTIYTLFDINLLWLPRGDRNIEPAITCKCPSSLVWRSRHLTVRYKTWHIHIHWHIADHSWKKGGWIWHPHFWPYKYSWKQWYTKTLLSKTLTEQKATTKKHKNNNQKKQTQEHHQLTMLCHYMSLIDLQCYVTTSLLLKETWLLLNLAVLLYPNSWFQKALKGLLWVGCDQIRYSLGTTKNGVGGAKVEVVVWVDPGVVTPLGSGGVTNAPVGGWKKGTVGLLMPLSAKLQPM